MLFRFSMLKLYSYEFCYCVREHWWQLYSVSTVKPNALLQTILFYLWAILLKYNVFYFLEPTLKTWNSPSVFLVNIQSNPKGDTIYKIGNHYWNYNWSWFNLTLFIWDNGHLTECHCRHPLYCLDWLSLAWPIWLANACWLSIPWPINHCHSPKLGRDLHPLLSTRTQLSQLCPILEPLSLRCAIHTALPEDPGIRPSRLALRHVVAKAKIL